jgi:hypothetical protein
MPAGNTYEAIATTTLGSAASSVTFSSISGSYTDLVIICLVQKEVTGGDYIGLRFNSDTGNNYSRVRLSGNGSTAASYQDANQNIAYCDINVSQFASPGNLIINLNNYSNTTTYKTALTRSNNADSGTAAVVNLWRSTSAITSVTLLSGSNLAIGSTFSLYGIKAA